MYGMKSKRLVLSIGKRDMSKIDRLVQSELADRSPGYQEETLETAGCTGQCPNYPWANYTEDGYPDCSECPESEG